MARSTLSFLLLAGANGLAGVPARLRVTRPLIRPAMVLDLQVNSGTNGALDEVRCLSMMLGQGKPLTCSALPPP